MNAMCKSPKISCEVVKSWMLETSMTTCEINHAFQNIQSDCPFPCLFDSSSVHQIRFRLGLCPRPCWRKLTTLPKSPDRPFVCWAGSAYFPRRLPRFGLSHIPGYTTAGFRSPAWWRPGTTENARRESGEERKRDSKCWCSGQFHIKVVVAYNLTHYDTE